MTTGNITYDHRTVIPTFFGSNYIGTFSSRQWTGTDNPIGPAATNVWWEYHPYGVYGPITPSDRRGNSWSTNATGRRFFLKQRLKPPKRKFIVEHPYTCFIAVHNGYMYTQKNSDGIERVFSTYDYVTPASVTVTDTWTANDDLLLLGKLREKVAGSSFNAAVSLGESREALRMITNHATKIARAMNAVRRGDIASAAVFLLRETERKKFFASKAKGPRVEVNVKKTAAEHWLELQYGWLPLLKDVYEGAQFLAHMHSVPLQHVVRARRRIPLLVSVAGATWHSKQCWSSGTLKCILREKDTILLAGLVDPLSLAWELLPFSFVADWFIPIGNYLSARGLSQSLQGTFVSTRRKYVLLQGATWSGRYGLTSNSSLIYKTVTVTRTVNSTLQVPLPAVKELAKAASWRHCVNAVALVISGGSYASKGSAR